MGGEGMYVITCNGRRTNLYISVFPRGFKRRNPLPPPTNRHRGHDVSDVSPLRPGLVGEKFVTESFVRDFGAKSQNKFFFFLGGGRLKHSDVQRGMFPVSRLCQKLNY